MNLKIALEYKLSLLFTVITQVLTMYIELFTIQSLFTKFSLLDMYDMNQLMFSFAIIWLGFSLSEVFARGFDHFKDFIVNGTFDILLIRPRSIYAQVLGSNVAFEKLGRIILAAFILISSYIKIVESISILNLLLLILMIISSFVLFSSIFIIGASFCFKTIQGLEFVNIFTDGSRQLAQYPMGIYNKVVRIIFTLFIPITCVNYFPMLFLTGDNTNIIYLLCPFASFIFLGIAVLIFNKAIKHYYSTGS